MAIPLVLSERAARLVSERKDEVEAKSFSLRDKTLRWEEKVFGAEPQGGHSLWISMHGGGGTAREVNDQQWANQIRLYQLEEGIYLAPRAPTDNWNLWHEGHIDPMFARLIEDYVALRGVNPDKVYLMGYSAGGDGVWQLAPRMADRFAAAAMMAGHPNDARLEGVRNLPFAVFVGGEDRAYKRNEIVAERAAELDRLEKEDPGGYVHMSRIYEGLPHWMNGKDAEAIPWMARFKRNPWPKKIVWVQDDVTHDRFYWIRLPKGYEPKAGEKIVASVEGQTIRLDGDVPKGAELLLSDKLVDLDQPLKLVVNQKEREPVKVARKAVVIIAELEKRLDAEAAGCAVIPAG